MLLERDTNLRPASCGGSRDVSCCSHDRPAGNTLQTPFRLRVPYRSEDSREAALDEHLMSRASTSLPVWWSPHEPRDIQTAAGEIAGQVAIVEAETGSGKTEAALCRFARLSAVGEGIRAALNFNARAAHLSHPHASITSAANWSTVAGSVSQAHMRRQPVSPRKV